MSILLSSTGLPLLVSGSPTIASIAAPAPASSANWGTGNAANSAQYDAGSGLTNGTYGAFSVSGGRYIDVDGTQTAGTYDVSGVSVTVDANYIAVGDQTEFNALTSGDYGKTVFVRKGAALTWNQTSGAWGDSADMQGTIVRGDEDMRVNYVGSGNDADRLFDWIKFRNCHSLKMQYLRIQPVNIVTEDTCVELQSTGSTLANRPHDIEFEYCLFKGEDVDPNGDHSSQYTGARAILQQANQYNSSIRLKDCIFYGFMQAIELPARAGSGVEIIGNEIDINYLDFIKINSHENESPVLIAANYAKRPFALPSDTGNPHSDVLQLQGGTGFDANICVEGNWFNTGNTRGDDGVQVWYIAGNSGSGISGILRANGNVDSSIRSHNPGNTNGFRTQHSATIPNDTLTLPYGGAEAGHRYDGGAVDVTIEDSFFGDYLDSGFDPDITVSNSTKIKSLTAAALTTALPAYPIANTDTHTLRQFIDLFEPASGQSLDGQGPWSVVNYTDGAEYSTMTFDSALVPTPVLSGGIVTPGTTDFTAVIQTTVDLQPIFWAVVPSGTVVTDPDDIRHYRIAGALDYGNRRVLKDETATNINITGTAAALASGTAYDLVMYQRNGWSVQSAITTVAFTTL